MGRHRRSIDKRPYEGSMEDREVVEERLGLNDLVCCSCNVRNPSTVDKCRRCGHTDLRKRNRDFQDA